MLISGLNNQPEEILKKTGLYDTIGEEHFFKHTGDAIQYALNQLRPKQNVLAVNILPLVNVRLLLFKRVGTVDRKKYILQLVNNGTFQIDKRPSL